MVHGTSHRDPSRFHPLSDLTHLLTRVLLFPFFLDLERVLDLRHILYNIEGGHVVLSRLNIVVASQEVHDGPAIGTNSFGSRLARKHTLILFKYRVGIRLFGVTQATLLALLHRLLMAFFYHALVDLVLVRCVELCIWLFRDSFGGNEGPRLQKIPVF